MGLFCGKKCKCKRRCKSWFSGKPDLERACKKACDGDKDLSKENFLCSGDYVDEMDYMARYKTDPCPNSEFGMDDLLDPLGTFEREKEEMEDLQPIFIGLGILVAAALIILFIVKKK